ncbi:MAG: hypothetical protein ABXS91_08855 [Sulfurimonas sp.]
MSGADTNEKESNDYIWEPNRTSASKLPTSEHTMDQKRREMIRKALDFDIIDVRSYAGYRGDLLVEFTTMEKETVLSLKKAAEALGLEVTVRQDPLLVYQVYCIAITEDAYGLKD